MLTSVPVDTTALLYPAAGLRRFHLASFAASPLVSRFVERYWIAEWDLRGCDPHVQDVLPHPVANVCFEASGASIHGVNTGQSSHRLEGTGRTLGVTFRPGGFRPFVGHAMSLITNQVRSMSDVFGTEGVALEQAVLAADTDAAFHLIDELLARRAPRETHRSEVVGQIVERVAADASLVRVDDLARELDMSVRQLQRLFREHIGVGPKWIIRRYRLYEVGARAAAGTKVHWVSLAAELGYSDQAHLIRDFRTMVGMTPERYLADQ